MSNLPPSVQKEIQSATALANAGQLVSGIIKEIAGNDISTSINGFTATNTIIQTLAHQRVVKQLTAKV